MSAAELICTVFNVAVSGGFVALNCAAFERHIFLKDVEVLSLVWMSILVLGIGQTNWSLSGP